ncbi:MAG: ribbon-helix-helix protein, CopG family [Candidatus Omnitrophota bacterium]
MAKKITLRLDDETVRKIDELARRTQIPKVRLSKQAYDLLFAVYKKLSETYKEEVVDINLIDFINNNNNNKKEAP